jgi:hypothetical protein
MMTNEMSTAVSLDAVEKRFQQWSDGHEGRVPIPDELWDCGGRCGARAWATFHGAAVIPQPSGNTRRRLVSIIGVQRRDGSLDSGVALRERDI